MLRRGQFGESDAIVPSFLLAIFDQIFVVWQDDVRVVGLGAVVLHDVLGSDALDFEDKVFPVQIDSLPIHCWRKRFDPYNVAWLE